MKNTNKKTTNTNNKASTNKVQTNNKQQTTNNVQTQNKQSKIEIVQHQFFEYIKNKLQFEKFNNLELERNQMLFSIEILYNALRITNSYIKSAIVNISSEFKKYIKVLDNIRKVKAYMLLNYKHYIDNNEYETFYFKVFDKLIDKDLINDTIQIMLTNFNDDFISQYLTITRMSFEKIDDDVYYNCIRDLYKNYYKNKIDYTSTNANISHYDKILMTDNFIQICKYLNKNDVVNIKFTTFDRLYYYNNLQRKDLTKEQYKNYKNQFLNKLINEIVNAITMLENTNQTKYIEITNHIQQYYC